MLRYRSAVVGSDVGWVEVEQRRLEELQSVDSDELESYLHEMDTCLALSFSTS